MTYKKDIINRLMAGIVTILGMISCSEKEGYMPVSLDQNSLTYKAGPGQITLFWDIPNDADYRYVRINYTTPAGECMRTASVYSDSIKVDNLLKSYGAIDFKLTTVSKDGTEGTTVCSISAQAEAAEKTITVSGSSALTLDGNGLWTDAQEPSEGPIANLIDGDASTFFHMNWGGGDDPVTDFPHYIVVDLGKEVSGVSFTYKCRDNANCNNPSSMEVYGTQSFDGETFDETSFNPELLASLNDLPATQAAAYSSAQYVANQPFRYLWLKVLSEVNGNYYVALAELTVNELQTDIVDPEENYLNNIATGE